MSKTISEDLKKIMLAGVGAVAMTADKASELVNTLVKKGELTVEQGKVLNEELKHNFKEKWETFSSRFENNGKAALSILDKMSTEDINAVKEKLEELEKSAEETIKKNAEDIKAFIEGITKMSKEEIEAIKNKLAEMEKANKDGDGNGEEK